jgi:hypothetical protein
LTVKERVTEGAGLRSDARPLTVLIALTAIYRGERDQFEEVGARPGEVLALTVMGDWPTPGVNGYCQPPGQPVIGRRPAPR